MAWTPAQLRVALSGYVADLTPTADYWRASTDAWTASEDPLSPDQAVDEGLLRHLLYSVDVREAQGVDHDASQVRVPVSVWFVVDLHQLGAQARALNWDRGLEAARALWRWLDQADRHLSDLTVSSIGLLYRLSPLGHDWALGEARITVICQHRL